MFEEIMSFEDFVADRLSSVDVEDVSDEYDDMLRDCYGDIVIGILKYDIADTFKEIDPIAYKEGLLEYFDSMVGEELEYFEGSGDYYRKEEVDELRGEYDDYVEEIEAEREEEEEEEDV